MDENPTTAKEQYELAEKYRKGEDALPQNWEKATYWFTKAAEQGYAKAQEWLGGHYKYNEKDEEKAAYWYAKAVEQFTKAAEQGDVNAQKELSKMYGLYLSYNGIRKDKEKIKYWLLRAVDSGDAEAKSYLGSYYLSFEDNREKAVYWKTKAAEQGYAEAQENLGYYYEKGLGVSLQKDERKAAFWYTKAAEQGNENAKKALAKLNKMPRGTAPYSTESSGGCYIATCVYGSYDCPEVWTLRRFRDNELSNLWLGRQFIRIYYAVSPKIVELFGDQKWFSKLWKPIIDKIVHKLQNGGTKKSS